MQLLYSSEVAGIRSNEEHSCGAVLHLQQMRNAITVRLPAELAEWLESTAAKTGVSQGNFIRQQLENARDLEDRPFLRLAGRIAGPAKLSSRKGFSET
ncbi:MAG: ribbon-helix-helix protein, CopG family [Acidobacteriaceae bacterium]|nr:ribbon-helix-helix protein, CopG family [Acidobacteriaceae bacterium]